MGVNKQGSFKYNLVIQKYWRGYTTRRKLQLDQNENFFIEENFRTLHLEAQQTALNRENEIERMILEVENLDFIMNNIEIKRNAAAKVIQRCWKNYLRRKNN